MCCNHAIPYFEDTLHCTNLRALLSQPCPGLALGDLTPPLTGSCSSRAGPETCKALEELVPPLIGELALHSSEGGWSLMRPRLINSATIQAHI